MNYGIKNILFISALLGSIMCSGQRGGELDTDFGTNGKVLINAGQLDDCKGVLSLPDGSAFVYGESSELNIHFDDDALLVKLKPSGALDSSFGNNGILRFDFPGQYNSRIIDATWRDDHLFFIGEGNPSSDLDTQSIFIGKLQVNGTPDQSFGVGGYFNDLFNTAASSAGAIAVDDANRVIFCGTHLESTRDQETEFPLAGRLTQFGTRDSSFGETGTVRWSSADGLQQRFKTSGPQHIGKGAQIQNITIMDDHYLFPGFIHFKETIIGFALLTKKDGSEAPGFGNHGTGIFEIDFTPEFNSSILNSYVKDSSIFLVAQGGRVDGNFEVHIREVSFNGEALDSTILDFGGSQNRVSQSFFDGEHLYLAGYTRIPDPVSGDEHGYFGVAAIGTNLQPVRSFGKLGNVVTNFPEGKESGANCIEAYGDDQLLVAGYVEVKKDGNFTDIAVIRLTRATAFGDGDQLQIYPNPVSTDLHVPGYPDVGYTIISSRGEIVMDGRVEGPINLEMLPSGVYFFRTDQGSVPFVKF